MFRISRAAGAVALVMVCATGVQAANRFFINSKTVVAGATGEEISVRTDNDVTLYGFSFGINYDEDSLTVTQVTNAGTDAASADYFDGRIDTAQGLAGYGCILDMGPTFETMILPGANRVIAKLVVDVIGAGGTSSQLLFQSVPTNPDPARPVKNIMTTDQGTTIVPSLVPGTITIENRAPVITSFSNNAGQAGQVFQIVGNFFGEPGLSVRVCSAAASATLRGDGHTLDVTAPACVLAGPVEVQVCTVRGCDSDPAGFTYEYSFVRGDANFDHEIDISDAIKVLLYLFVPGTTTNCPDAFDANDRDNMSTADAVYIAQFLFTAGSIIPAPYPAAGKDTTADTLPKCVGLP